jgi:hypothetical protein
MAAHQVRSYDYVNHPYVAVRQALTAEPAAVFRNATRAAASRASSVAAELRVSLAGLDLAAEIAVSVGQIEDVAAGPQGGPATRIPLNWEAAGHPRLFPLMQSVLSIYPLTATETQLDFLGRYEPPLGVVGGVVDALVLHRLAEASVHRFIGDVAAHLRQHLAARG